MPFSGTMQPLFDLCQTLLGASSSSGQASCGRRPCESARSSTQDYLRSSRVISLGAALWMPVIFFTGLLLTVRISELTQVEASMPLKIENGPRTGCELVAAAPR